MAAVILEHVEKIFPPDIRAVRDFNLLVNDGELIVLLGPSGCGKSTTLNMIAGLEDVTEGQIRIGDRVVNDVAPSQRDIAMVFQDYALYPHMTVYENLAFGLRMRKAPRPEIDTRVRKAADTLDITSLLDRKPRALSGGQRQRVALGRAIVRDPAVFLFDEPLSNLDAKLRSAMRTEIKELHLGLEQTMIYVTHDQLEAMTLADRIVVMSEGVIQQVGTPLDVYDRPANRFVADFIGTPPMSFLEGRLVAGAFECDALTWRIPEPRRPQHDLQDVVCGFRPEDVSLEPPEGQDGEAGAMPARVRLVEPLGGEALVHLDVGGRPVQARLDARANLRVGDEPILHVLLERIHLFDCGTYGESLSA